MFNTYNLPLLSSEELCFGTSGTCPNQTIFAENRWRGGLNVKKLPVAVSIAKRRIPNPPQLGDIDLKQAQY